MAKTYPYPLRLHYKGFTILSAKRTGGKAGKGQNKTSTVQIFECGESTMQKSFRFRMYSYASYEDAIIRAKTYIDTYYEITNFLVGLMKAVTRGRKRDECRAAQT